MYKALYRKYRPLNFDNVYGQDVIVKTLRNSIINNSYSHAYIFFGPRGTGKTSISKIFARSVNCLNPINGNSCGECKNCKNSYEKECVDIIEIDAASNNGVDEIRELKNKISLVPTELKYKVYIIDEVHMLSIGAFNALLKTIEEPPEHVIFILATTDPQKIPETIISRCQTFSFKRISGDKIVTNLKNICEEEKIDIENNVLEEIAFASDGGMRDALSILDQLHSYCDTKITLKEYADVNGSLTNEELNAFINNIMHAQYAEVLNSIKKYNDSGKNIIIIMEKMIRYLRNQIVEFYLDSKNINFEISEVQNLILLVNEKMIDIKKSSNPNIYIEMLLLEFMNNFKMNSKQINSKSQGNDTPNSLKIHSLDKTVENSVNLIEKSAKETENFHKMEKETAKDLEMQKEIEIIKTETELEKLDKDAKKNMRHIKNLDEIIEIRVNNTLAKANKQILMNEISALDIFNDYTFDQEIGYVACAILDGKLRAASEENLIMSYEFDSIVDQNLDNLEDINNIYNKITNSNKKLAIISDAKWDEVKKKYIEDLKNKVELKIIPEPEEVFIEEENNDIINTNAIDLFGDIVEVK